VLFWAYDDLEGYEWWVTDTSTDVAQRISKIRPGTASSGIHQMTVAGAWLFFEAHDGVHGGELWRTDGTESGTVLVRDIYPGIASSSIQQLTTAGNVVYFVANDGAHGHELWRSDGTEAGTNMVTDIVPGASSPAIQKLAGLDDSLVFVVNDRVHGSELWRSDGTAGGTMLLRDLNPGIYSGVSNILSSKDGSVYFEATEAIGRALWTSDGTHAGTRDIVRFDAAVTEGGLLRPGIDLLMPLDGGLLAYLQSRQYGRELWFHSFETDESGDFNRDGVLNVDDLDEFISEISVHSRDLRYDMNADRRIDLVDRDAWLLRAGETNLTPSRSYSVGDVNLDGAVDAGDFSQWNSHRFQARAAWSAGDLNADGAVDGRDFLLWNASKYSAQPASSAAAGTSHLRLPRSASAEQVGAHRRHDVYRRASIIDALFAGGWAQSKDRHRWANLRLS
jgi:ELWxxDGT repeat protein